MGVLFLSSSELVSASIVPRSSSVSLLVGVNGRCVCPSGFKASACRQRCKVRNRSPMMLAAWVRRAMVNGFIEIVQHLLALCEGDHHAFSSQSAVSA